VAVGKKYLLYSFLRLAISDFFVTDLTDVNMAIKPVIIIARIIRIEITTVFPDYLI